MEVETSTQPAMFASTHDKNVVNYGMPIEGVMKIDDYLNMHQADHDAHIPTPAAPAPKKSKPNNENAAPLLPVAVGARSSKHTILLHERCQALGIPQPLFTYGGGGDSGWTISVSFPGLDVEELQDINEEGKFNSKQEAKEASSKTALAILEELVKEGKVKKAEKVKAKKKKSTTGASQQEVQEREPSENYVGQLLGKYKIFHYIYNRINKMIRVPALYRRRTAYLCRLPIRQPIRVPPHHRGPRHAIRLSRHAPPFQKGRPSRSRPPRRLKLQSPGRLA
jgi:hypothetical protein